MHARYHSLLENFKWARNNTIELFECAQQANILNYTPDYKTDNMSNRDVLYQFQCVVTTTDARIRQLTGHNNTRFGRLITKRGIVKKREIGKDQVADLLLKQGTALEKALRKLDEFDPQTELQLKSLIYHEYLHHGQLIVMFRETDTKFPKEFDQAWALSKVF